MDAGSTEQTDNSVVAVTGAGLESEQTWYLEAGERIIIRDDRPNEVTVEVLADE